MITVRVLLCVDTVAREVLRGITTMPIDLNT